MLRPLALLSLVLATFASSPARAGMKAGAGRAVITPERPIWMGGYAARTAPSDGKLHDLFAKALVLEDEAGTRVALVTLDLLGTTRAISSRASERIAERCGIPREATMFLASHTHSGPVLRENLGDMYDLSEEQRLRIEEYSDALPEKIADAVAGAVADLAPCRLARGLGEAGFAVNRRQYTKSGIAIGVNPIGPTDHDVPVLVARAEDGTPRAVLFGYACHNTTLSLQQISGDYAGYAQAFLEENLPGTTALFATGCGADQNPHPRREIELARRHGIELGVAVIDALRGAVELTPGVLRASLGEIPLALTPAPPREEIEKQLAAEDVYVRRRAASLLRRLDAEGSIPETYPYPVQTIRLGDGLDLVALGGEVVVDYSLRLKHELGRDRTFVFGYANDVMAYVPSLRVLREGGYEGGASMVYYGLHGPWTEDVEESIVTEVRARTGR